MAKKMKDIAGFRASHKRIPTSVAMNDDQNEMAARTGAIDRLGAETKDKKPNKKPLADYSQFGLGNARRLVSDATGDESSQSYNPSDGLAGDRAGSLLTPASPTLVDPLDGKMSVQVGAMEEDALSAAEQILAGQLDPEERERRIARARASQEAMVRSTMGAGEAGRSGAAALLEGEAGRLAESQTRIMEMQREMGLANLATYLEGFDLAKERYDDAEIRQAQLAIMYAMTYEDLSYDEAADKLGISQKARTPAAEKEANDAIAEQEEIEANEQDEEDALNSYTGEEGSAPLSGVDVYAWAGVGESLVVNNSGFDAWMGGNGEVNWNGPVPTGYSVPDVQSRGWKNLEDGTKMYKMTGPSGVIWVTEDHVPSNYGDSITDAIF